MLWRYTLAWLPMALLAILNGALRDLGYRRWMSALHAQQLSTVLLILVFALYVLLLDARWPLHDYAEAAAVGFIWLVLTLLFEFGIGRLVAHRSWEALLQDYDIASGNLWPLVPLAVAMLPTIVLWART